MIKGTAEKINMNSIWAEEDFLQNLECHAPAVDTILLVSIPPLWLLGEGQSLWSQNVVGHSMTDKFTLVEVMVRQRPGLGRGLGKEGPQRYP